MSCCRQQRLIPMSDAFLLSRTTKEAALWTPHLRRNAGYSTPLIKRFPPSAKSTVSALVADGSSAAAGTGRAAMPVAF